MGEIIDSITKWGIDLVSSLGYFGVLIGMILNSAGIPVPSEIIAGFSGYLVFKGELNLIVTGLVASLGNIIGGTFSYMIGLKGGRPVIQKYGKYVRITEQKFEKIQKWFDKYGDEMVLLGQFIPIFRSYVSLPAGVLKVPLKKFLPYTFIGSFIWITLLAFVSSQLGEEWGKVGEFFDKFKLLIIAGLIVLPAGYFAYKLVKNKGKKNIS
ncbi:DedA family protein [Candidatus Dojkabacteria bacterium]|nr:DedA family protein [Candidatus Dojkabacteria bacterium]